MRSGGQGPKSPAETCIAEGSESTANRVGKIARGDVRHIEL